VSIVIKCPACGKGYKVGDDLAGKRVKCKCGQTMVVPAPAAAAESDAYDLAPMGASDPSSLLDEDLPPAAQGPPLPRVPVPPPAKPAEPAQKAAKKTDWSKLAARLGPLALVGLVILPLVIILVAVWLALRPGFGSPEDAFAAHQKALRAKDWDNLIQTYSPESQEMLLDRMLRILGWRMIDESVPEVEAVLKKHGLGELMDDETVADASAEAPTDASADASPDAAPIDFEALTRRAEQLAKKGEERRKRAISAVKDKAALYAELNAAVEAMVDRELPNNPVLAILTKKPIEEARRALADTPLTDLKIDGDSAEGQVTFKPLGEDEAIDVPVEFKRIDGRWYLHTPDEPAFRALLGGGWL
jgi:hypothetical protein